MPNSDHQHFQVLHLVKKLTQLCTESGRDKLLVESAVATTDVKAQNDERHLAGRGDQALVQRGPGVDVSVTEVSLQPDLLSNARKPLVDSEVSGGRASS